MNRIGPLTLALVSCLALPAGIRSQQTVFRSGVDLVTVDVSVVDGQGSPIQDLGAERFDVRVDGLKRRVVWAEYVPHQPTAVRPLESSVQFSTNENARPGRLIMVAVDQMHIRRVEGLAALRAVGAFLDALDPADRAAAAPLTHLGPIQFTGDHAAVKRYVETLAGTASPMPAHFNIGLTEALAISEGSKTWLDRAVLRECGEPLGRYENPARVAANEGIRDPCPVQVEQESRAMAQEARTNTRQSLNNLIGLIQRLSEIDGPKTLVLVSEGLIAEPQLIDMTALGAAAQAARVTIYVLQLEIPILDASDRTVSPTLQADQQAREDGLVRLAGTTRGALFRLVGADPYPFNRILRELSGYYLVAFEATSVDRDGRTHRIDVSVNAPGAIVRARPAFRGSPTPSKAAIDDQLVRLLRNPRLVTEVPLRVAAFAFKDQKPGMLRVLLSAEAAINSLREVTIGVVLIDDNGVIAASGTGVAEDGRLSLPVQVHEGRYVLRAAAVDAGGRKGSVDRQVLARLLDAGPVQFSDLVIAETGSGKDTLRAAVAQVRAERVTAVFDIYGFAGGQPEAGSVKVEISREGDASPAAIIPAKITPAGPSNWRASAEVPLLDLSPGTYIATAHVTLPGIPKQRLDRAFIR